MSFGLTNALIGFQEFINKILAEKFNIFVIVYLDNTLIYINDNGNGYIAVVKWVLEQIKKCSLYANLKKC